MFPCGINKLLDRKLKLEVIELDKEKNQINDSVCQIG